MKKMLGICVAFITLLGGEANAQISSNMKVSSSGTEIKVDFKAMPQVGAVSLSFIHLAKTGDTLWSIARKYGLTVDELTKVNRLDPQRILLLNQRIIIPVKPRLEGNPVAQKNPSVQVYIVVDEKSGQEKAATTTVQSASASSNSYEVKKGDTLYSIARRHQVTVEQLTQLNGLTSHEHLKYGMLLKLPRETEYQVQAGDTLHQIARKHRTSVQALAQHNQLKEQDTITVGQRLKIPL
ncbi:LysM peptidoglycan-binding domain-containing protein [Ammoniphilus sp. YIM 78166]|uniref:LysM peptidoglycan-binding domain-containing protein n=1 Tax=Ammoniphilus sp. YIM 78166 TaxID=1644106 RepID=UPI00142F661D|nr:LysM peptidoglycan-binding domain-containing protein [Ammoniphilus sp. YIM 78166]